MSRRTHISLAASAIVGTACIATISTDAFAYRRGVGVGRAGVYHGGVYRGGLDGAAWPAEWRCRNAPPSRRSCG